MQPPIYRRTQSRASLALPDYSRYFRKVRVVRQRQSSPVLSVSSSRYKQSWRSSLHDTWHPIMLRQSLVLQTLFVLRRSFVLRCSFVLRRFSFTLQRSSLVLQQVLARALMVIAHASTVLARNSTVLACDSTALTHDLTGLIRAATVLRRFISHVTRDKVWSIRCCRCVYLILVQNRD